MTLISLVPTELKNIIHNSVPTAHNMMRCVLILVYIICTVVTRNYRYYTILYYTIIRCYSTVSSYYTRHTTERLLLSIRVLNSLKI